MRALLAASLLLLLPLAAAAAPVGTGDVPVYAPVGNDYGVGNIQLYTQSAGWCTGFHAAALVSVPLPLGSFVRMAPAATPGWSELVFRLRVDPTQPGCSPTDTLDVLVPFTSWPTDYNTQTTGVAKCAGQDVPVFLNLYRYGGDVLFGASGSTNGQCLPGEGGGFGLSATIAVDPHPSTYQACDPLLTVCAGVTQSSGGASCGDGTTEGSTWVVLVGASRSCNGSSPQSWSVMGGFLGAYGGPDSCSWYLLVAPQLCPGAVGTAASAVPWGHVLP
jgi:hypothetical protein